MLHAYLYLQSFLLACGAFFSFSALSVRFREFLDLHGTLFQFRDCLVPNPMTTPCFFGSLAFLAAFVWSVLILFRYSDRHERGLRNLLVFGAGFAAIVLVYETLEYAKWIDLGSASVSCSPGAHPLSTPCFTGLLFFLVSGTLSFLVLRSSSRERSS